MQQTPFRKMALRNLSAKIKEIPFRNVFDISVKRPMCEIADSDCKDVVTHTKQKWEDDDYRRVRFIGKEKHVNPNWGINLIAEIPPIPVKGRVTYCDGGSGPTGHPKVFINLDKPGYHSCSYCGLRFCKEDSSH